MPNKLVPDAEFHDITDIAPEWLAERGISGLALDMDNTVARYSESEPAAEIAAWLNGMLKSGIKAVMVSNSHHPGRVSKVCGRLNIAYTLRAAKPSPKGFLWAANELSLPPERVAAIGDQIFTDVWGGNRAGCFTILVYPRGMDEHIFFRLRRFVELPFARKSKYINKYADYSK